MSRSRQLSVFLVSSCLALALAACGGGDDDDTRPQPTTTAPETTQSQEEEAEAALRQLAEDWYAASDAIYQHRAEPESASEYLVDPYLSAYVEQATEVVDAGRISRPSDTSRLEIIEVAIDGDSATVTECAIDADVLLGPDGEVIDDNVYAQLLESDAVRGSDGWHFSDRRVLLEEEGTEECPSA